MLIFTSIPGVNSSVKLCTRSFTAESLAWVNILTSAINAGIMRFLIIPVETGTVQNARQANNMIG